MTGVQTCALPICFPVTIGGGWKEKYVISKKDGSEVDSNAVYFVLRLDEDPHARVAARMYAESVREENSELANDICIKISQYCEKCENCDGTGRVLMSECFCDEYHEYLDRCPDCDGSGMEE